jgi:hypothetical protein
MSVKNWSFMMREEHRPRMFKNGVVRRYLGLRGEKEQETVKNFKNNKLGGACGMDRGEGRCLQVFVGNSEGKRPLGRTRLR